LVNKVFFLGIFHKILQTPSDGPF